MFICKHDLKKLLIGYRFIKRWAVPPQKQFIQHSKTSPAWHPLKKIMSIKQSTQILGNSLFLLHIPSWIDWACQNAFWDIFLRQLQFQCWECGYLRSELPYWMDNMPAFPRRFIDLYTRPFIQSLSERVIAAEDMLRGWLKVPCDEKRFMTDIDISARLEWLNSVGLYYELPDWESELKAGLEASRVASVSPPAKCLGFQQWQMNAHSMKSKTFYQECRWSV